MSEAGATLRGEETVIALLVLALVVAVVFSAIALPFVLIVGALHAPPSAPSAPSAGPPWTDDDEIAARHHH